MQGCQWLHCHAIKRMYVVLQDTSGPGWGLRQGGIYILNGIYYILECENPRNVNGDNKISTITQPIYSLLSLLRKNKLFLVINERTSPNINDSFLQVF